MLTTSKIYGKHEISIYPKFFFIIIAEFSVLLVDASERDKCSPFILDLFPDIVAGISLAADTLAT